MTETSPERLSLVVFSGDYDRVHYALAMAAAAAATARPVTMLFTMGAIHALRAAQANGVPGWAMLKPASSGNDAAVRCRSLARFTKKRCTFQSAAKIDESAKLSWQRHRHGGRHGPVER